MYPRNAIRRRFQRTLVDNGAPVYSSQPGVSNDLASNIIRNSDNTSTPPKTPPKGRDQGKLWSDTHQLIDAGPGAPWWQSHTLKDVTEDGGKGKGPSPWQQKINKYLLTDEQYQKDRADLLQNFRNMRLGNLENRGNLKLDYSTTKQRLSKEQADNLKAMQADFAARGLYGGAGYQDKLGDFNLDYLNQRTDAQESFQRNLGQLLRDLSNARTLEQQNMQQARLEAIRRRAAELGITG